MTILQSGAIASTGGGYQIERSLRFNSADTAYLNKTFATNGTGGGITVTFSAWVKRGTLGSLQSIIGADSTAGTSAYFAFNSSNNLEFGQGATTYRVTNAVFRDPSAWYHIVWVWDSSNATDALRCRIYVNGTLQTYSTSTSITLNTVQSIGFARAQGLGADTPTSGARNYFNGYLTEINFIDGQALTPSDFGETDSNTGVWKPKAYSGTYGTNGFYLKFADNSGTTSTTLGKDSSGNGNNWTPNLFSVTAGTGNDSLVDSPTSYGTDTGVGGEVRGNYCTLNPLTSLSGRTSFSNGNLQPLGTSSVESGCDYGTIGVSSGKWYWECTVLAVSSASSYPNFGAVRILYGPSNGKYIGDSLTGGTGIFTGGTVYKENSLVTTVSSYTTNDVIGIALDVDNLTCAFYKNGTLLTTVTGLTAGTYWPGIASYYNSSAALNTGQRPFQKWNGSAFVANTAPSGFKALCTQNLPTPTIGATSTTQANDYFNAVTYTGNGSSQSVTGVGFQPDLVWIKNRATTNSNRLIDAVRGATKELYSDLTSAEYTEAQSLTSFNSGGFSVGNAQGVNGSGNGLISWNWKANGAGSSNTAGTITSTVSANTTSGFSIVKHINTGVAATIGHGLGVAPVFIINKVYDRTENWRVYFGFANKLLILNTSNAETTDTTIWNNTQPTSTVFSIGAYFSSGDDVISYCFAPVAGYSAFGSYTGNGSADGPFVFTNFRPRFVMIKRTDTTANWRILDTARDTYNIEQYEIYPNLFNAEGTFATLDGLSNGFKIRNNDIAYNASGGTYIYMALAENPFKYSLAR